LRKKLSEVEGKLKEE
jgi:hypothetical protein